MGFLATDNFSQIVSLSYFYRYGESIVVDTLNIFLQYVKWKQLE